MPPIHRSPKKNEYNTNLQFDRTCTDKNNEKNKMRKRKITWFNPPFNINVATNITTISNNNHHLLQLHRMKESTQDSKLCNCRQKNSCPLDCKCLTKCFVYKTTVTETTLNNQETYIRLTANKFKTRFNLLRSSFKLEHKRTSTTFSEHVLTLKNKIISFNIKWEVLKKMKPFAPSDKVCKLCLQEKTIHP